MDINLPVAALTAFFIAAALNYYLSIKLIFRHKARWRTFTEVFVFLGVISSVGLIDMYLTSWLVSLSFALWAAKVTATAVGLVLNFVGRRFIVFPEPGRPDWKPQNPGGDGTSSEQLVHPVDAGCLVAWDPSYETRWVYDIASPSALRILDYPRIERRRMT